MQSLALFFRLWVWFSFRHLHAHRWRALAVLLGIGLGAAVFTSVRLAVNASLDSFSNTVDTLAGKADWSVVRPGGRVPENLVADLLAHPAVQTVSPVLSVYVQPKRNEAEPFLLIGIDPILDRPLRSWQTNQPADVNPSRWLDLLSEPYTLFAGEKLLRRQRLRPGSQLVLEYVGHSSRFKILGELAYQDLATAEGGDIAIADIATIQEFTGLIGLVDRMDIVLRPTATGNDLQEIRALLPEGVVLAQPSETKTSGRTMIKAYQLNLSVLSFVSLFVGMFLVYSLVALNATSRRHELAILRSIGASSRMLFFLFLGEGAFFGMAGWLIAIPLGAFMVRKLLGIVSSTITHLFVRVKVDSLHLNPWEILLSLVITVLVAVLAAYQPARAAMEVAPREAFLMHEVTGSQRGPARRLALAGFVLILLVYPLALLPDTSGIPLTGYIATFFLFSGFSLLSPWCLHRIGARLPSWLRRLGGQPAYLGGRYLRDAGARIAISVGALITAMALFVALVIMVHSFRNTVETWVNQSIRGDMFLQPTMSNINRYRDPLPPAMVAELQNMAPQVQFLPYHRIFLRYGAVDYLFEAIDFEAFSRHGKLLFLRGDPETAMPKVLRGEGILISEVFASQTGLDLGGRFQARIEGVTLDLPIVGIFRDYRTQGGVVHYPLTPFEKLTGNRTWTGTRVFFPAHDSVEGSVAATTKADLRRQILQISSKYQGVNVTFGEDLRQGILRIFDETFAITTVLLLIALFVAALGITSTLTVLVLERTRQLNTLLAIGAGFGQVRAMIFWEAILIVAAGEVLGTGCGFILSLLLIFVINQQSFGWTFVYSVDWISLLTAFPLIFLTALLASLPACQLAFRHPPAQLLRER